MLFTISGKHIEITDAIREHAQDKTEKLPRYYNSINQIEVIVEGNDGGMPSVEVIARAEHGKIFIAKETGEDTYACIDVAVHKVERQIRRKKEKERNNKHIGAPDEYGIGIEEEEDDE
jgi:putative sigma-54 modulation protein